MKTDNPNIERLFTVSWEERVIICAQIWAKTPEKAKEIAAFGSLDELVNPSGCFSSVITDSIEIEAEIEGARKTNYKSGGNNCIEIYY